MNVMMYCKRLASCSAIKGGADSLLGRYYLRKLTVATLFGIQADLIEGIPHGWPLRQCQLDLKLYSM